MKGELIGFHDSADNREEIVILLPGSASTK